MPTKIFTQKEKEDLIQAMRGTIQYLDSCIGEQIIGLDKVIKNYDGGRPIVRAASTGAIPPNMFGEVAKYWKDRKELQDYLNYVVNYPEKTFEVQFHNQNYCKK